MNFKITVKKADDSLVKSSKFTWRIQEDSDSTVHKDSGTADTNDNGLLTFASNLVAGGDYVLLESSNLKSIFKIIIVKPELIKTVTVEEAKKEQTLYEETASKYDISKNNREDYDWIIWETEGNSDPKYQRGGKTRKLGLYKLNYDKLRKAGGDDWQAPFKEESLKGGGWIKVAVLESEDYSNHMQLINMFLPCFEIKAGGKIEEPVENQVFVIQAPVGRTFINATQADTLDVKPPVIVLPFNYDDNGEGSRAVGKNLSQAVFGKVDAKRLKTELTRWATASRSTITAFPNGKFPDSGFPNGLGTWKTKDLSSEEVATPNEWTLRPAKKEEWTDQITGPSDGVSLRTFQENKDNADVKYYSVKTGVQYVSTQNQISTSKDLLEENSIHAMNRSNLIKATMKRLTGKFEADYQVEILSILILKDPDTMRSVERNPEKLKNKALEDNEYREREAKTKLLSDALERLRETYDPGNVNDTNKTNIERVINDVLSSKLITGFNAAAEIKEINQAKNTDEYEEKIANLIFKIEGGNRTKFNVAEAPIKEIKAKLGFDGIQVREISDAGANDIWFPALAIPCHGKAFAKNRGKTDDWTTFWKENFAVPLGRAKGEMLVYFGMQHMTSNSQNFIVAFDRKTEGGKLKKLILRDIGDTLYNNYFFEVLKELDPLYKKEWEHESGDPDFGVTLSSALGSYTMPRMTRIGATIVFFFGPFIQGDIVESKNCYKILVDWCIAHNRAFLDYMKEKIGYSETWGGGGKDDVSPNFLNALSKRCNLNKANDLMYQKFVVPDVLALSSKARLNLIKEFEIKMASIPEVNDNNKTTTETLGIELVNAHEVLICAEVQCYIQSETGKTALRNLHKGTPVVAASSVDPVKTGQICFRCKTPQDTNSKGWHRCNKCSSDYCADCIVNMPLPIGIPEMLRKDTEERRCLDQCNGITELIR